MTVVIGILAYWFLLSIVTTACFVWLRCTNRINFVVRK